MPTIAEYAPTLRMSPAELLSMCQQAGLDKQGEEDMLSNEDKVQLVHYMRNGGTAATTVVRSRTSGGQVEIPRAGAKSGQGQGQGKIPSGQAEGRDTERAGA